MKRTVGFCILFLSVFLIFSCATNNALMKDVYAGYYNIAEEYFKMEKYAKAVEFYEKCLSDNDELTLRNVKYKLAQTYLKLSKWSDASKIYEELLQIDLENTNLKTLLAYSYMKQELFDDAEKIYLSLIESQSLDQSSYKNLILLYGIKNDFEKTETELASYKEKFPLDETIITIETEISNLKKKFEEEQKKAQEEVEKSEENVTKNSETSDESKSESTEDKTQKSKENSL